MINKQKEFSYFAPIKKRDNRAMTNIDIREYTVLYLIQEGLNLNQIALKTKTSQPTISRIKTQAEQKLRRFLIYGGRINRSY